MESMKIGSGMPGTWDAFYSRPPRSRRCLVDGVTESPWVWWASEQERQPRSVEHLAEIPPPQNLRRRTCLVGAVDITLYRDDLDRGNRWPVLKGTDIPFVVDGAEIVLVDDVLFTGRTVRAAMNSICDLWAAPAAREPWRVVDRGGRELPIQADYVGLQVEAKPDERVEVHLQPIDPEDEIVRLAASAR